MKFLKGARRDVVQKIRRMTGFVIFSSNLVFARDTDCTGPSNRTPSNPFGGTTSKTAKIYSVEDSMRSGCPSVPLASTLIQKVIEFSLLNALN